MGSSLGEGSGDHSEDESDDSEARKGEENRDEAEERDEAEDGDDAAAAEKDRATVLTCRNVMATAVGSLLTGSVALGKSIVQDAFAVDTANYSIDHHDNSTKPGIAHADRNAQGTAISNLVFDVLSFVVVVTLVFVVIVFALCLALPALRRHRAQGRGALLPVHTDVAARARRVETSLSAEQRRLPSSPDAVVPPPELVQAKATVDAMAASAQDGEDGTADEEKGNSGKQPGGTDG